MLRRWLSQVMRTDAGVVEPSEFFALHAYSLELRGVAEVMIDEGTGECKEANEAQHQQGNVCQILDMGLVGGKPLLGSPKNIESISHCAHLDFVCLCISLSLQ